PRPSRSPSRHHRRLVWVHRSRDAAAPRAPRHRAAADARIAVREPEILVAADAAIEVVRLVRHLELVGVEGGALGLHVRTGAAARATGTGIVASNLRYDAVQASQSWPAWSMRSGTCITPRSDVSSSSSQ